MSSNQSFWADWKRYLGVGLITGCLCSAMVFALGLPAVDFRNRELEERLNRVEIQLGHILSESRSDIPLASGDVPD